MTSASLPSNLTQAPAFARASARTYGVTDVQLQRRHLTRISQGWYSDKLDPADTLGRCTALLETLPEDAVFSDGTAARLYGLPVPTLVNPAVAPVHVTLSPRPVIPQRREIVVHQRHLPDHLIRMVRDLPVTSPERLYADLAMSLSLEDLAVVGDALVRTELATTAVLQRFVSDCRPRRGLRLARAVLPLLDGRAQSPPETVVRLRLNAAGLPAEPQCPVVDGDGRLIGHADLGFRKERVAVEYEGRHHAEGQQFDYDIDRYSRFAAAGWLVIRCGGRDLRDGCLALAVRVRTALTSR